MSASATNPSGGSSEPNGTTPNAGGNHTQAEQAARNAVGSGANDTLLLAALVLGFAVAVSGVVVAAGRRGGRRVH